MVTEMIIPTRFVVSVLAMALALLVPSAPAALADTSVCTTKVVDLTDTHVLDQGTISSAVTAAETAMGADIYVRAYQHTPGGNAASWWRQTYPKCSAWVSADGKTPKPNVLVIEFGMDRTSAIAYGSNFDYLASQVDAIRAKKLNSSLREREYTDGVLNTLTALKNVKENGSGIADDDAGVIVLGFLAVVAGIALLGALVYGNVRIVRAFLAHRDRRRDLKFRLAAALHDLDTNRAAAATAVSTADVGDLTARFELAVAGLPQPRRPELRAQFDQDVRRINELSGEFAELSARPEPGHGYRNLSELRELSSAYRNIEDGLTGATNGAYLFIDGVIDEVGRYTDEAISADIALVEERLKRVSAAHTRIEELGYLVSESRSGTIVAVQRSIDKIKAGNENIVARRDSLDTAMKMSNELQDTASLDEEQAVELARAGQTLASHLATSRARIKACREVSADYRDDALKELKEIGKRIDSFLFDTTSVAPEVKGKWVAYTGLQHDAADIARRVENHDHALIEARRRKERDEARRKQEAEDEERRRRNNSSSSMATGAALGYGFGSSSSSSSGGFGGGSFGSFGGGSFGGGSFGGW
jgi:uncharacterized membrane protein YgcG